MFENDYEDFDDEVNETEDEVCSDSGDVFGAETDENDVNDEITAAALAADYVRSFEGFEKAADYVERHFEGEEYTAGDVITVNTRNSDLEGEEELEGVTFTRRDVELAEGLVIEGVFPEFESIHHVELGDGANEMSLHQQFSACKADFQDHMYDDPDILKDITFGDMEKMDKNNGYAPEGWTWNHNPEVGSYDLVLSDIHSIGHTGGNALWGK